MGHMSLTPEDIAEIKLLVGDAVQNTVPEAIKKTVNGKIDAIRTDLNVHNTKHENDMAELKPYMQFASGLGIMYKFVIAIGSLAIAWAALMNILHGSPKEFTDVLSP